jgi:hypothetical protein
LGRWCGHRGLPTLAQEASPVPAAVADEHVPQEFLTVLIQWDTEDLTYRAGEEEGTVAYLLSLPEAEGWEFVTILAESWREAAIDEQPAWDVFRWRVLYRRPFESGHASVE